MKKVGIKFSLRKKFLIPTVLLVILGMGFSSAVSYLNSKSALDRAIKDQISKITESTAGRLNIWAERTRLDLSNWSKSKLYLSSLSDDFVGHAARKSVSAELALLAEGYQFYESINVADSSGEVIASSLPEAIGKIKFSEQAFFNQSMAGKILISDVFKSTLTGNPVIAISSPMKEEGAVAGALIGIIDIGYLSGTFVDSVKVGEKGYAFIFDRNGLIIAHPDKEKIMKMNMNDYDFGRTMMKNKEGILIYSLNNEEKIVSYKTDNLTGWCISVGVGTTEVFSPVKKMGFTSLTIAIIVVILLSIIMWLISGMLIIKPISKIVAGLKDIAEGEGDLTTRLEAESGDEVGELSKWFNKFMEQLQTMIKEIRLNADTLNSSSTQLSTLSGNISEGVDNMSSKANTVSSAAEEMTTSINSVATSMEEASTNMNLVATAAEELTATISEISRSSDKARSITGDAVTQADDASNKIGELGRAAQEIGKVTEAITEISEQTNLLALNATIEAARAGEAGKGFAVVANEIKELAGQTAEATQDIKARINSIQTSTSGSVIQVDEIAKVINEVNEIVSSIAIAVGEQSETTKEIAGNVSQASMGIQEVSRNMSQSSTVAEDIAKEIAGVNHAASDMSNGSSQVDLSAQELSQLAAQLREMVGKFKVD